MGWCSAYKVIAYNKFVLPIFKQIDSAILSAASINLEIYLFKAKLS